MRRRRLVYNVLSNVALQIALAASGFIIPKLIITCCGSAMNGMISSVTQFLSYAALVEAGVGDASIVALYGPLADGDQERTGAIVAATGRLYSRSGILYALLCIGLACLYPVLIRGQLEATFVAAMVLVLSCNGVADYFFLGKYKVLLIADQKSYVVNLFRAAEAVCMLGFSYSMLAAGRNILAVKLGCVAIHGLQLCGIRLYAGARYGRFPARPGREALIGQRFSALIHKICCTVVYNTDLVVLTIFLPGSSLLPISVYTVYAMAGNMAVNMIGVLTAGIQASFGNMYAKGEEESLKKSYEVYEYVFDIALFLAYTSMLVLIDSFVACYTREVADVRYVDRAIGLLFTGNCFLANLKDPAGILINAAGKYKETRKYAVAQAIINIVLSVLLVGGYGVAGVLAATLASHIYMLAVYVRFAAGHLLKGMWRTTIVRMARNLLLAAALAAIEWRSLSPARDWGMWIAQAAAVTALNGAAYLLMNAACEPKCMEDALGRLRLMLNRKKDGNKG